MKKIIATLVATTVLVTGATLGSSAVTLHTAKVYSNCKALNKVYPGGVSKAKGTVNKGGATKYVPKVSKSVYIANKTKDRDKDGIACER